MNEGEKILTYSKFKLYPYNLEKSSSKLMKYKECVGLRLYV